VTAAAVLAENIEDLPALTAAQARCDGLSVVSKFREG